MWRRRHRRDGVWLVVNESDEPGEPVLGVFATASEASAFLAANAEEFPELAYGHYAVGWSYQGTRYTRSDD